MPIVADDIVWMIGVNTTRPTTWKSGRVDAATLRGVEQSLRQAPTTAVKVLVAHHPFDNPGRGAAPSLESLTAAGIDVFLTGHLHTSYTGHTAQRYNAGGRSAVVVDTSVVVSSVEVGSVVVVSTVVSTVIVSGSAVVADPPPPPPS
jgi:2',3'-cyclic-nucleotide 2'-phosphodiesterase (5'-nucleotidase family)